MIVAEVQMLTSPQRSLFIHSGGQHNVQFDCLETAQSEYDRIVELMRRRDEKANDIPTILEVVGAGNRVSFPIADLCSVGLADYEHVNRARSGLRESFPNLF